MYVLDLVLVMTVNDFACQLLDSGDRITILQHDIKISLFHILSFVKLATVGFSGKNRLHDTQTV